MSKNEILKIHKQVDFLFEKTCEACPEQYDVYLASDTSLSIAYVRVRFGQLTVHCPDAGGKLVYQRIIGDEFRGTTDIHDYVYDIIDSIQTYYMLYVASKIKAEHTTKILSSKYEDDISPITITAITPGPIITPDEMMKVLKRCSPNQSGRDNSTDVTGDGKNEKKKKGKEGKEGRRK